MASYGTHFSFAVLAYWYSKIFGIKKHSNFIKLDSISQLSPNVCRILGQNPGPFTLQGTNTYLVGATEEKILIDCGDSGVKQYIDYLKEALGNDTIKLIVCTHWHNDHIGGIPDIFKYVTNGPVPVYKREKIDLAEVSKIKFDYISPGNIITVPGVTLRCIATPGHTSDHISLYFEEENSLFSGDCILGESSSVFEDLCDYMHSLETLSKLNITRIYPGHGAVIEKGLEKIHEYITHRKNREDEILKILGNEALTSTMQITNLIYKITYILQDIPWSVKLGAINNVNKHLMKLVKEKELNWSVLIAIAFLSYQTRHIAAEIIQLNEKNNDVDDDDDDDDDDNDGDDDDNDGDDDDDDKTIFLTIIKYFH
ncbi:Beta-lactamase-like protein 2 [Dirofilaria immitis]|nr:Beta-lactamase-like protein 2 [Dirofilaria immitis]